MSTLNPKHLNRIYWVPLPNNVSCTSGEEKFLFVQSQNILKQVSIYLPGISACLDNHIGMVSEETTYSAGLCTDTVVKQPKELCFLRQKQLSPFVIGYSTSPGSFGLAQQVFIQLKNWQMKGHPNFCFVYVGKWKVV